MRNAQVGEWILSMVTSRESAASTVGDLIENPARRGAFWFYASVARTAGSLLWKDFAADRQRLLGFGALGLVIAFAAPWALSVIWGIAVGIAVGLLAVIPPPLWVSTTFGWVAMISAQFQVGRWLAGRFPGRELAPCLALTILDSALSVALYTIWGPIDVVQIIYDLTVYQIYLLPMFVGATWVRRTRLSR